MLGDIVQRLWDILESLKPFVIINQFERGVALRFGKKWKVMDPGLHWIIPFGLCTVFVDNVVWRTMDLGVQSLMTKDGKTITLRAIVTARIDDIEKAILEVEGVDHAIKDACSGSIGTHVANHTWDEIVTEDTANELAKVCRRGAKRFGVEIDKVQLTDLTQARAIRLLQDLPLEADGKFVRGMTSG
jgi:regulator of protease activity HflC (stomatin/prohibitin superfamily)